jgi:hypothetical protein
LFTTLLQGVREGFFVLRMINPDRTSRTFWRREPDEAALKDPSLEVVLPDTAELSELDPRLLLPNVLPRLWEGDSISVGRIIEYHAGGKVVQVPKQGYEEPVVIPKAGRPVIEAAVNAAVQAGQLWLLADTASVCGEPVPPGLITESSQLQAPPPPVSPAELLPEKLAAAWNNGTATGQSIADSLSVQAGKTLPWPVVKNAIEGALRTRMLERAVDSGLWPCDGSGAATLKLTLPGTPPPPPPPPPPITLPGVRVAEADMDIGQFQDLADQLGDVKKAAAGFDLKLHVRIELSGARPVPSEVVNKINQLLEKISDSISMK